jgi:hypothetical protein
MLNPAILFVTVSGGTSAPLTTEWRCVPLSQKIPPHRVFCGPTTTSAHIGADVDEVMHLIQTDRANDHPVEGTSPDSCGTCSDNSAAICSSFAYLAANNPPSLAR